MLNQRGILYYDSLSDFPTTGDTNFYYVDNSTDNWYLFNGTSYDLKITGSVVIGGVPSSRELTIQGQTYDLSADRTFTSNKTTKTTNYTITDTDRIIECNGTFVITLPLLASITHYDDIDIINTAGSGTVTINTSGGEYLTDVTTFDLYAGESLTIKKGDTKYLVK